jgi:hypothetical protein
MRDGIEYEFDVCGDMVQDNTLQITKSRCPRLAGAVFSKPGQELAKVLKEWLGGVPLDHTVLDPPNDRPATPREPKEGGVVNGVGGLLAAPVISEELASIWRRMCSPRGVAKELEELKIAVEQLAGSEGVAEFARILRQH